VKGKGLLIAVAGIVTLAMSFAAFGSSGAASAASSAFSSKAVRGGTLTVSYINDFATLDPAQWDDAQSLAAMQQIYDTLVEYKENSDQIGPGLAQSWTVSADNLTYTFKLRNAVFSNGHPVTAQDVDFSLSRVCQPGANSPYAGFSYSDIVGYSQLQQEPKTSAAYTSWNSKPMLLSGIKVLGPHSLSITLVHPEAYFLNDLALYVGAITDPAVVAKYGPQDKNNAYEEHAVGSGPFELQSWVHNQKLTLVANPKYWGPKPYLAKVVFLVGLSDQTQEEMFQKGQIQIIEEPDTAVYQYAMANPTLAKDYHTAPMNWVLYGYFDCSKPPFNNVYLRQALNYALDKPELIKVAVGGRGVVPSDGVLPPGMPAYQNTTEPYPYNVAKAKQLLAKAGYANGLSFKFYIPADTQDQSMADVIQQDWKQIGVNIQIVPVSTSIYWTQASPPATGGPQTSYDAGDAGWMQDYPDPSDFFSNLLTGSPAPGNASQIVYASSNEANYNNAQVDQLVNEANTLPPSQDQKRWQLYDQAQKIVEQEAPWLFEYFSLQDALVYPTVGPSNLNLYLHPIKQMQLQYVWVGK